MLHQLGNDKHRNYVLKRILIIQEHNNVAVFLFIRCKRLIWIHEEKAATIITDEKIYSVPVEQTVVSLV